MPISEAMHRPDRYDDGRELDTELPDLPLPRPGEGSSCEHAAGPAPIQPPRLGGGASFTAATEGAGPAPAPLQPPAALNPTERERLDSERFTWEIASRLTAGMLANPGRHHTSVKDAMAMFDQFLQEMSSYTRISSEFGGLADGGDQRRRDHSEYFHGARERADQPAEAPAPIGPAPLKPQPAQPAPMPGYQPLPPGARGRYVPGSMAGAPPPVEPDGENETEAA